MNIDTLFDIRSKLAEVASLVAHGLSLEDACSRLHMTIRSYRRWAEVVKFTRTQTAPLTLHDETLLSLVPEFEAAFGRMRVSEGETLFEIGGCADYLYVIVSGSVDFLEWGVMAGAGETAGEIGVFSEMNRHITTAVTAEDCELVRIPHAKALEIVRRRPSVALSILQIIADRLAQRRRQSRSSRVQRLRNSRHVREASTAGVHPQAASPSQI